MANHLVFLACLLSALSFAHAGDTEPRYILVDQFFSRDAADDFCRVEYGTSLASIHSAEENTEAFDLCDANKPLDVNGPGGFNGCWIGYYKDDDEFTWTDSTADVYSNWRSGAPNHNAKCTFLKVNYPDQFMQWEDSNNCPGTNGRLYALCNAPSAVPPPRSDNYILAPDFYSRDAADEFCYIEYGTSLASIHSAEDNTEAFDLCDANKPLDVNGAGGFNGCWIGYYKEDNGEFVWTDTSADDYSNWRSGAPNHNAKCTFLKVNYPEQHMQWEDSNNCPGTNGRLYALCNAPESPTTKDPTPAPTTREPTSVPTAPTSDPTTREPTNTPTTSEPTSEPTAPTSAPTPPPSPVFINAETEHESVNVTRNEDLATVSGGTWKLHGSSVTDWALELELDADVFGFEADSVCTLSFSIEGEVVSDGDLYFGFGDGDSYFAIIVGGSGGVATHVGAINVGTYPSEDESLASGDVGSLLDGQSISKRDDLSKTLCQDNKNLHDFITDDSDDFPISFQITNDAQNEKTKLFWENGDQSTEQYRSGTRQFASAFNVHTPLFLTVVVDPQNDKVDFSGITISRECADPVDGDGDGARSIEKQHDEGNDAVAFEEGGEEAPESLFVPVLVASLGVVAVMAIALLLFYVLRVKNKNGKTENVNEKEENKPNVDGGRVATDSVSVEMSTDVPRSTATISV